MRKTMLVVLIFFWGIESSTAQSIDPQKPAPLKPGPNSSMIDDRIGTQYWYFWGGPGATKIIVRYKKNGQSNLSQKATLDVDIYDENRTWVTHKSITPQNETSEAKLDGDLKQRTKVMISVSAPRGGLVASGGDYEIVVSGAADFSGALAPQGDPIVGTYSSSYGAVKFNANGTLETEDGTNGKWRLFDPARRVYVITVGNQRFSLKQVPGLGLVNPENQGDISFREVH